MVWNGIDTDSLVVVVIFFSTAKHDPIGPFYDHLLGIL
jgi:hypothetical protein